MNFRMIRPSLALVSLLAVGLGACAPQGSFREVKVAQGGGEVALDGDRTLAHQKAEDYMKSKCQAGFTILEEGEVTVGSDTESSSSSGARSHGITFGRRNSSTSSTRDATEWRVKYQCKDASPAPAVGGAAPAAPAAGASLASPKSERVAEVQEVRVRL
ncbi:MAG TPA: hypothetical protein VGI39_02045 [Polyangiaceae bacterium]|jgi:hypothetical protein